jgi:predicted MFS family arabinose efflux permease
MRRRSHAVTSFDLGDVLMPSRLLIWVSIFIGSTIGGIIPELWGAGMFSYPSLLLSGIGALVGLWIAFKI